MWNRTLAFSGIQGVLRRTPKMVLLAANLPLAAFAETVFL
jgi:hypothetical protein